MENVDKFLAYTALVEDISSTFLIACTAGIRFVMAKIKVTLSVPFFWICLLHEIEHRIVIYSPFLAFSAICHLLPSAEIVFPFFALLLLVSAAFIPLTSFLACFIKLSSADNLYG